ncbi:uncharacterized protein ACIBXB_002641 isoform 1-T1 [Morphnus guianensis]
MGDRSCKTVFCGDQSRDVQANFWQPRSAPISPKRPAMKMATLPGSAEDTTSFEFGPSGRGSLPIMQWSGTVEMDFLSQPAAVHEMCLPLEAGFTWWLRFSHFVSSTI